VAGKAPGSLSDGYSKKNNSELGNYSQLCGSHGVSIGLKCAKRFTE
jgi:hypothetical protein